MTSAIQREEKKCAGAQTSVSEKSVGYTQESLFIANFFPFSLLFNIPLDLYKSYARRSFFIACLCAHVLVAHRPTRMHGHAIRVRSKHRSTAAVLLGVRALRKSEHVECVNDAVKYRAEREPRAYVNVSVCPPFPALVCARVLVFL